MARTKTSRAPQALALYESTIVRCFTTKASRRRALGVTANALDPWERGTLVSPNEDTVARLRLVAAACDQLGALFTNERTIGEYLESPVMAGVSTTRLELMLRSGDPELPVRVARQEARAVAQALGAAVPPDVFDDEAWRPIIESMAPANRELYEELRQRSDSRGTSAVL